MNGTKDNKPFKKFYFEGNLRWGNFNNPDDVRDLLKYYNYEELRKARIIPGYEEIEKPCFGFYSEYCGKLTLGEWIDKNNQEIYFK